MIGSVPVEDVRISAILRDVEELLAGLPPELRQAWLVRVVTDSREDVAEVSESEAVLPCTDSFKYCWPLGGIVERDFRWRHAKPMWQDDHLLDIELNLESAVFVHPANRARCPISGRGSETPRPLKRALFRIVLSCWRHYQPRSMTARTRGTPHRLDGAVERGCQTLRPRRQERPYLAFPNVESGRFFLDSFPFPAFEIL